MRKETEELFWAAVRMSGEDYVAGYLGLNPSTIRKNRRDGIGWDLAAAIRAVRPDELRMLAAKKRPVFVSETPEYDRARRTELARERRKRNPKGLFVAGSR